MGLVRQLRDDARLHGALAARARNASAVGVSKALSD
jgi:hypothetical protein